MCGIAGFCDSSRKTEEFGSLISKMTRSISNRGPDDFGSWVDAKEGITLGHRRLAILDLSAAGHQPMLSASGRFVIAFNGEIYNHLELRTELESAAAAPAWRGHSDTETLLAAFEHWGLAVTLKRCVGMFAFALWDRNEHTLHLARDRFGEKPLYYGWAGRAFLFGSELKALRAFPGFANPICREALAQYLRLMVVPAPHSIYRSIYKLEPGCLLSVCGIPPEQGPGRPLCAPASFQNIALSRWWSLAEVVEEGVLAPITDEGEALASLDISLNAAVRLQSSADVPLGAFLSGGVDSSLIVALMQQQSSRPVKTFTVGFDEAGFDESPHALAVAQHLGTEHHELFVSAADVQGVILQLPTMYDEPFADSSQIPTHLVCRAARQHVTVALSGDAGDELFGGYNRYFWGPRIWDRVAWMPYSLRQALCQRMLAASPLTWDHLLLHAGVVRPGEKLHKLARALRGIRSIDDLYDNLVGDWNDTASIVLGVDAEKNRMSGSIASKPERPKMPSAGINDARERMMFWDSLTYLPDDILCKVDRAAMAISLETRVPFLDHRVAEHAWRLPMSMKIRDNHGKWALRQLLYRHVPRELIDRPKAGFAIPVGQWLRGPLHDWAESLLAEKRLLNEGYFNPSPIRKLWYQHLSGKYDWTSRLWTVLMFQAWLEENR